MKEGDGEDVDDARAALGRWKAGERTGVSLETAAAAASTVRSSSTGAASKTETAAHARGQLETQLSDLRDDQPQENCNNGNVKDNGKDNGKDNDKDRGDDIDT